MTPDEIREAAAIARRWRETQDGTRQKSIEAMRVEAERERVNRRLANLGPLREAQAQPGSRPDDPHPRQIRGEAGVRRDGLRSHPVLRLHGGPRSAVEGGGVVILAPSITCGRCSAVSPLDQWKGPAGAEFPPNRFQCPRCAYAFERRPEIRHGQHVIRCVAVNPELSLAGGDA